MLSVPTKTRLPSLTSDGTEWKIKDASTTTQKLNTTSLKKKTILYSDKTAVYYNIHVNALWEQLDKSRLVGDTVFLITLFTLIYLCFLSLIYSYYIFIDIL